MEGLKRRVKEWNVCDGLWRNRQRVIHSGRRGEKCGGEILWFRGLFVSLRPKFHYIFINNKTNDEKESIDQCSSDAAWLDSML